MHHPGVLWLMFNVISLLTKKLLKKKKMPSPLCCGCLPGNSGSISVNQQAVLDSDKPNNIVPYRVDIKQNLVNSIYLEKILVISTRLNLYSKLNCF